MEKKTFRQLVHMEKVNTAAKFLEEKLTPTKGIQNRVKKSPSGRCVFMSKKLIFY